MQCILYLCILNLITALGSNFVWQNLLANFFLTTLYNLTQCIQTFLCLIFDYTFAFRTAVYANLQIQYVQVCSNSYVQSTMATAAAKIAQVERNENCKKCSKILVLNIFIVINNFQLKKTERDDNIAKHKEQKSSEQVVQNQCVQRNVQQQNVQQESVQQQSVQQQQITQHYQSTNQHHQQQSTVVNNIINNSSTSLANSESEWSPTASNMEISQQQQYNSNNVQQNSSSNNNSRAGSRRNSSQFRSVCTVQSKLYKHHVQCTMYKYNVEWDPDF